jgi:hypothetical protein
MNVHRLIKTTSLSIINITTHILLLFLYLLYLTFYSVAMFNKNFFEFPWKEVFWMDFIQGKSLILLKWRLLNGLYSRKIFNSLGRKSFEQTLYKENLIRGVTIYFFDKRYVSRYLICIIGNCIYSLKSMLVDIYMRSLTY